MDSVLKNLYLLQYNNYYNRIVKRESTLQGYLPYVIGEPITGISFNPNDYVDTQQIINWSYSMPDYVIVANADGTIDSRWFVTDEKRTRSQQFQLTLHRDLMVDYYDEIVDAPIFIEKATLEDSSPFIFNSEDMTFNQIKVGEEVLQDETQSAWIVGYCTSKTKDEEGNPLEIEAEFGSSAGADEAVAGISQYKYYKYSNLAGNAREDLAGYPSRVAYCVYANNSATIPDTYKLCFNISGSQPLGEVQITASGGKANYTGSGSTNRIYANQWNPACKNTSLRLGSLTSDYNNVSVWVTAFTPYFSTLNSQVPNYIVVQSEEDTIDINNQNGKIIYDSSTKKYYKVTVTKEDSVWSEIPIPAGNMYNTFLQAYNARAAIYDSELSSRHEGDWKNIIMNGTEPNANTFAIRTFGAKYDLTLTELPGYGRSDYKATIGINRYHLKDAPYDMFCIPYSDTLDIYKNGTKILTSNQFIAFEAVMALVKKYQAAGYIYDVQLLPFCPVRYMIRPSGILDIGDNPVDYITYTDSATKLSTDIGIIMYASSSSDTFNIPKNITYENKKIDSQCNMIRLCSPNYNGQFEFNVAKNNGVTYFNVDYTYKPFNPYIHVNPDFGGLYGQDFNDSRGLVCGGEFSLPAVSNQWDTYELQNKNYQNMFDRQIQNMEVNNSVQRTKDIVNIVTGTVGGATQGAMAGGMTGGPWGAVAGGVVGGVSSLAGGIADYALNEKVRNETLDYTKDMYGYNLQNIKALPYSLTRTTAFTYNNKIFPIIEYYTCTDEEKVALANKIAYNGMTVMNIGKISNYIENNWSYEDIVDKGYIKGKIIYLSEFDADFHISTAIAAELNKGAFFKWAKYSQE